MNGQLSAIPVLQGRVKRAICRFAANNLPPLTGAENLLLLGKEFFKDREKILEAEWIEPKTQVISISFAVFLMQS